MSATSALHRWPMALGLALWAITGSQTAIEIFGEVRAGFAGIVAVIWLAAFLGFGATLVLAVRGWVTTPARARLLVVVEVVTALGMTAAVPCYFTRLLITYVAWQAGMAFAPGRAVALVAAQSAVMAALMIGGGEAWTELASQVVFQALALTTALIASRESRARLALERTNAELAATRDELAEQTRAAERGRIARELHDAVGHHLAALSLQLEVASHQTTGPARDAVVRSQTLTRALLTDVRHVVSACRDQPPIDVPATLERLVSGLDRPRAHLALRGDLQLDDPEFAHTLVRCVQEMITNVLKHAGAANVWVEIDRLADRVEARVRDDGRGATAGKGGTGLLGMRERLALVGGELAIIRPPLGGWEVIARLPLASAA